MGARRRVCFSVLGRVTLNSVDAPALFAETPHRRRNALTGEWVLVSPHRAKRPWLGQVERKTQPPAASYDPACYLCPGNERAGGARNPDYTSTFAFDNDFAALLPDAPAARRDELAGIIHAETERGVCRVVCFSPNHALSVPRLSIGELEAVIQTWITETRDLAARYPWVRSVQIFENRGEMMGASNPHPHCQIWANATVPPELRREIDMQERHSLQHGGSLLTAYLTWELREGERVVIENPCWVAVVPYWAVWPFETLVIPRRHLRGFGDLEPEEIRTLADIMKRLTARYDNLFGVPFPYTMGFHQAPLDGGEHASFHFHAHYYPPLLRSAEVRKFMVGYEMLAQPQRDITPEAAAERLRQQSESV
ncbi:MAG: UDP-glucose--hexose-1-phosphate uridylyltransferase [Bryobacterales bacterium]|nr:UDP-glucose--hexose-1-phosphate uridylyltransferase [Bryobacterales bacterium]